MATVERSVSINAPVEEVFAYVSDPMSQVEWMPSMVEVVESITQCQGETSYEELR